MSADIQANIFETEDLSADAFAELLDAYDYDLPRSGEILKGIVLQVTDDEVILDVGAKHDAFVTRRDLDRLEDDLLDGIEAGAELNVYVLRSRGDSGELLVSINKALTLEDWERATELESADEAIDVNVIGFNKGGALVDFGRLRGFVPNSQLVSVPRGANRDQQDEIKAQMIGEAITVKVIEVNQRRNRLVLSETAARRERRQEILEDLKPGSVVKGRVVKLVDYGAFIDIGGVNGLAHISKLDWQHVNHPSDVLTLGEEIDVRIDDVDIERERISLNRQALLPDPWTTIEEKFNSGDLLTGRVSSVVDYGIFVELPEGITGLVHVSEMESYNVTDPKAWASEGDELLVRVISVDADRKRIGLSLDRVGQAELYDWMTDRQDDDTLQADAPAEDSVETDEAPVLEVEMGD